MKSRNPHRARTPRPILESLESRTLLSMTLATAGSLHVTLNDSTTNAGSMSSGNIFTSPSDLTFTNNHPIIVISDPAPPPFTMKATADFSMTPYTPSTVLDPATFSITYFPQTLTPVTVTTAGGTQTFSAFITGTVTQPFTFQDYDIVPGTPFTPTPTGTVQLLDGNTVIGTTTITNGKASFQPNLTAGNHQISFRYLGDSVFGTEDSFSYTQSVAGIPVSLQFNPVMGIFQHPPYQYRVVATAQDGETLNGQTVILYDGNTVIASHTLVNNKADFDFSLTTPGAHNLHFSLVGDDRFASANSSTLTVNGPIPITTFPTPTIPVVALNPLIARRYAAIGAIQALDFFHISGWALDRDSLASHLRVLVYMDGHLIAGAIASDPRPGLWTAFRSSAHGFDIKLPSLTVGTHHITLLANDPSDGRLTLLATRTIRVPTSHPKF